ncbi:MAG: beta-galactosidase [Candidatus Didemnitutus sp.]|nr:beta-galactosidase [Candidatus Didemnitutus sp.]
MKIRLITLSLLLAGVASATPLTLTVAAPAMLAAPEFHMGAATAPNGDTLTLDRRSLLLNGRRWTPVMGEFHFSRYPAAEWRAELAKMKAGGVDIVATYVFWIHHEEVEGTWNWSGDRNLRAFIAAAAAEHLRVIVRLGPWCHGEVRNGGLPDWIVARGGFRSDAPAYLAAARALYAQTAAQCRDLLWKDGGPVIGVQLENEYGGPAQHLLTLKQIARAVGFDVPLYTRTGWPQLATPMPFGEIVPLYGVYAEGFWDRETAAMPGRYWSGFHFSALRTDANIANEALGRRDVQDAPDVALYPYLTCEIGGGMMSSYHRRILVDPRDITALTLVKLGSGSVSPGYYMYHGGTNPVGRTPLMEAQDTAITNWNDMPVKNYDFQAPLGQYGQVRPHYAELRRLHSFLHDFGTRLAPLDTSLPDARPTGKDDLATLRWSVRADDARGFLFVNNHERGRTLPPKPGVQFTINFPATGALTLPTAPVTIPASAHFIWPLNLDLDGAGTLAWATAQPLAVVRNGAEETWYFAATPGVPTEFVFRGTRVVAHRGRIELPGDGSTRVLDLTPGREAAMILNSTVRLVVMDEADSLAFERDPRDGSVRFAPPPRETATPLDTELVHAAGAARAVPLGRAPKPVAAMPTDADFAAAAVWRIKLPTGLRTETRPRLRLHYTGDVARVFVDGEFVNDDYYNGAPLEIGLWRHPAALRGGEVTVAILPLARESVSGPAPKIYFSSSAALPDFGDRDAVAELLAAELITTGGEQK